MDKPFCTVKGMPQRGGMCPKVIVGGRLCGAAPGSCHLQAINEVMLGVVASYMGNEYAVVAHGDIPGTFDIAPYQEGASGDRFRNVPASALKIEPAKNEG